MTSWLTKGHGDFDEYITSFRDYLERIEKRSFSKKEAILFAISGNPLIKQFNETYNKKYIFNKLPKIKDI